MEYNKEQRPVRENYIEGRNAVLEAYRSGKTFDKLFVLDGCQDGPVKSITREAKKHDSIINYVTKERLDQMSETGKHQGVIAVSAAYEYAEVEDILKNAEEKGEPSSVKELTLQQAQILQPTERLRPALLMERSPLFGSEHALGEVDLG